MCSEFGMLITNVKRERVKNHEMISCDQIEHAQKPRLSGIYLAAEWNIMC